MKQAIIDVEVKIKDILLNNENPRFSIGMEPYNFKELSNRSEDFFNQYKINNLEEAYEEYDFEAVKKLLSDEGNLEKLKALMKSIKEDGFDEDTSLPPYIVKNNNGLKGVVVEGNRRLLSLKLLYLQKPSHIKFLENLEYNSSMNEENEENFEKETKNLEKNKKKILELIKTTNKEEEFKINIKIYDSLKDEQGIEKDNLIKMILSKHSSTVSSTKKEWSRSKNIMELLYRFKKSFLFFQSEDEQADFKQVFKLTLEQLSKDYKREKKNLKTDIYNGIKLKNLIKFSLDKDEKNNKKLLAIQPSAIELSFSKITSLRDKRNLNKFLNLKKPTNIDLSKYNESNFEELLKAMYVIGNDNLTNDYWEELSTFIMWAFNTKVLTTRGYKLCTKDDKNNKVAIKNLYKIFKEEKYYDENNIWGCTQNISQKEERYIKAFEDLEEFKELSKDNILIKVKKMESEEIFEKIEEIKESLNFNNQYHKNDIKIKEVEEVKSSLLLSKISESIEDKKLYINEKQSEYVKKNDKKQGIDYLLVLTWNSFLKNEFLEIENISDNSEDLTSEPLFKISIATRALIENILLFSSYYDYENINLKKSPYFQWNFFDYTNEENKDIKTMKNFYKFYELYKIGKEQKKELRGEIALTNWIKNNSPNTKNNKINYSSYITDEVRKIIKFYFKWNNTINSLIHKYYLVSANSKEFNIFLKNNNENNDQNKNNEKIIKVNDYIFEIKTLLETIHKMILSWLNLN